MQMLVICKESIIPKEPVVPHGGPLSHGDWEALLEHNSTVASPGNRKQAGTWAGPRPGLACWAAHMVEAQVPK